MAAEVKSWAAVCWGGESRVSSFCIKIAMEREAGS